VIVLGYGLLACVGFGSIAYHSSIKYSGQMGALVVEQSSVVRG
jgi:hypothetical protein